MSISGRPKCVGINELADLIELDAESLRRIADRVDVKAPQISGYLGGKAYLGVNAKGRLLKGLGLTTAGRFSSRRTYSWFLGGSLVPLRRLLKFIFGGAVDGNFAFEVKVILNEYDDIPNAGERGFCTAYAIRGNSFRAKLFRFKYENDQPLEAFDPETLGGRWRSEQGSDSVRLPESEWENWCQTTSITDFDGVFYRNAKPDYLDFEKEIQKYGYSWGDALGYFRAAKARDWLVEITSPLRDSDGGTK